VIVEFFKNKIILEFKKTMIRKHLLNYLEEKIQRSTILKKDRALIELIHLKKQFMRK
jgi:hypothetical protein